MQQLKQKMEHLTALVKKNCASLKKTEITYKQVEQHLTKANKAKVDEAIAKLNDPVLKQISNFESMNNSMVIQPKKITYASAANKPHSVVNFNMLEQIKEEHNISGLSPTKEELLNNSKTSKRSKKSSQKDNDKSREISER
jgi:hypothetical protein